MFFKLGVLKNFVIYRETPALESFFHKVAGLKTCNFNKARLQHRCFPVNIANFVETAFFIEHVWWLLLKNGKQPNEATGLDENIRENEYSR